ncbi:PD-(D/E)XK motif protein [Rathayibacter sp. VKM Ac-2929]|uniref:PD-(D/E)XK motif protein n=1 Tax=Rathayibacter sp. VKM Ac-2929 TaxID=2929480 RepID=UPI0027E178A3|nr:PD-(D/E)XK motif protein [Rathayibacter sp. VKM Ac-2929]
MSPRSSTAGAWAVLSRPSESRFESYLLRKVGARHVRAALDDEGHRHLLVPLKVRPKQLPQNGEVVVFDVLPLAFGDETGLVLDIACTDVSVHGEFDLLIDEVTDSIETLETAGAAALDAVDRWRRLLALQRTKGLSFIEQLGLAAELMLLEHALSIDATSIPSWRGPFREPHDFEFARDCIEVKALAGAATVEIHGLEQLSEHEAKSLHLALVEVSEADDGATVVETARRLRDRYGVDLSGPLSAARLDLEQDDSTLARFVTGFVIVIRVTGDTPRLTVSEGASSEDFSGVSYSLRTAALLPYSSGQDLDTLLKEVLHA